MSTFCKSSVLILNFTSTSNFFQSVSEFEFHSYILICLKLRLDNASASQHNALSVWNIMTIVYHTVEEKAKRKRKRRESKLHGPTLHCKVISCTNLHNMSTFLYADTMVMHHIDTWLVERDIGIFCTATLLKCWIEYSWCWSYSIGAELTPQNLLWRNQKSWPTHISYLHSFSAQSFGRCLVWGRLGFSAACTSQRHRCYNPHKNLFRS